MEPKVGMGKDAGDPSVPEGAGSARGEPRTPSRAGSAEPRSEASSARRGGTAPPQGSTPHDLGGERRAELRSPEPRAWSLEPIQRSRLVRAIFFLLGAAGLSALVLDGPSLSGSLTALSRAGPLVALFVLLHALPLASDTLSWASVLERPRPRLARLFLYRYGCESANNLLPVARVGGDVARALLAARAGVPGPTAGASVVVDMAVGVWAEALVALGAVLVLGRYGQVELSTGLVALLGATLGGGVLLFVAGSRGVVRAAASRIGERVFRGRGSARLDAIAADGARLAEAVDGVARRPRAVLACLGFKLTSALLAVGELWLGLRILGRSDSISSLFVIQGLGVVARSSAFVVPAGLGVQESAFVLLGGLVGVPSGAALALALMVRLREIVLGAPGLALLLHAGSTRRGPPPRGP